MIVCAPNSSFIWYLLYFLIYRCMYISTYLQKPLNSCYDQNLVDSARKRINASGQSWSLPLSSAPHTFLVAHHYDGHAHWSKGMCRCYKGQASFCIIMSQNSLVFVCDGSFGTYWMCEQAPLGTCSLCFSTLCFPKFFMFWHIPLKTIFQGLGLFLESRYGVRCSSHSKCQVLVTGHVGKSFNFHCIYAENSKHLKITSGRFLESKNYEISVLFIETHLI